ncbi:MAG: ANTAR domain-containing response regulator, partial [Burkholderiales bacterium]
MDRWHTHCWSIYLFNTWKLGGQRMLRVMLVDDTGKRIETLQQSLQELGYEVVLHDSTSVDLCRRAEALDPDIIVIGMDSPDRDTLEHICVMSCNRPRPVVMFTHDGDADKIKAAIKAGVSAYVVDGLSSSRV